jgi:hypothetical protein
LSKVFVSLRKAVVKRVEGKRRRGGQRTEEDRQSASACAGKYLRNFFVVSEVWISHGMLSR